MRKRHALLVLLLSLLAWKVVRTDWIVSTPYWFYDSDPPPTESITTRTFTPPVSPAWRPPEPRDFDSTATTWQHHRFFPVGGAWGPTEEPRLHVNWTLLLVKVVCAAVIGYVVILVACRFLPRGERRTNNT